MIFLKNKKKQTDRDRENLLEYFPSDSRYAESYRTFRTNLFFTVMEKDLKSVVVTSCLESEGKTTTSINLGFTIAQADRKVLLIDLDLRRPHLSNLFNLKKQTGVTDLVADVFGIHLTRGSLDNFSINDLIQLTKLQSRTCCLNLRNENNQVSIFFEKGSMVDIYWKNRPESKKLANTLIERGLLTKEEAALALGRQKKSVQRLGTILYMMGFVTKKNILKTLSLHTIEGIRTVAAMQKGQFDFSNISSNQIGHIISKNIDFEKLYAEFNTRIDKNSYFRKNIESAIRPTDTDNLFILPSGTVPPNPAELIGSERTKFLIDYLKNMFDFIIIDTPPVMPVTDALMVAPRTEGAILVIRSGHTDRKIIKEALGRFKTAGQPVIGAVLNRVNMKREGYYRYYQKYYSSCHG